MNGEAGDEKVIAGGRLSVRVGNYFSLYTAPPLVMVLPCMYVDSAFSFFTASPQSLKYVTALFLSAGRTVRFGFFANFPLHASALGLNHHRSTRGNTASSRPVSLFPRERVAFGKPLSEDSLVRHNVAQSRMEIAQVMTEGRGACGNCCSKRAGRCARPLSAMHDERL